jgi:hypothetical protein
MSPRTSAEMHPACPLSWWSVLESTHNFPCSRCGALLRLNRERTLLLVGPAFVIAVLPTVIDGLVPFAAAWLAGTTILLAAALVTLGKIEEASE